MLIYYIIFGNFSNYCGMGDVNFPPVAAAEVDIFPSCTAATSCCVRVEFRLVVLN